jgi:antitoxin YefM
MASSIRRSRSASLHSCTAAAYRLPTSAAAAITDASPTDAGHRTSPQHPTAEPADYPPRRRSRPAGSTTSPPMAPAAGHRAAADRRATSDGRRFAQRRHVARWVSADIAVARSAATAANQPAAALAGAVQPLSVVVVGCGGTHRCMATIVAMQTLPLGDARDRFSALVTSVEQTHDRVTVTRNGVPAAVIVSPADLAELEETIAVLSSPELMRQLAESREDVQRGDLLDATEDRESLVASVRSRAGR